MQKSEWVTCGKSLFSEDVVEGLPICLDLELKNSVTLQETNSMQLIEGCFFRSGLVPAFQEIAESLGQVRPKKFARLALLSGKKRYGAIEADIEGRKEKLDMLKRFGVTRKKPCEKRKFVRTEAVKQ